MQRQEVSKQSILTLADAFPQGISQLPEWLQRVITLVCKTSALQQQYWDMEVEIRNLEKQIAQLEVCPKKMTPSDLEKIYPVKYKTTPVRPTDYKVIKLEELKFRIDLLASQQVGTKEILSIYNTLKTRYLFCLEQYNLVDKQLSDYSKELSLEEKSRQKCRFDVNSLPIANRIVAVSNMPGAISLSVLMDIFVHLKLAYEKELRKTYSVATGKILKFESFEDLYLQLFKKPIREYFKECAKKSTAEMSNINEEFKQLNQDFWQKINTPITNQKKYDEFNAYFLSAIYLSSTYETFRFTDKVQRLDISSAIWGFIGGSEDVATEFLKKLSATQIENSFAIMPFCSATVMPLEETYTLWLEAVIWLYGFHQRAYSQISPHLIETNSVNQAAFTHIGDEDDRQFFENKAPLVKWTIAQYHAPHCQSLLLLLPPNVVGELLLYLPQSLRDQHKLKYPTLRREPRPLPGETFLSNSTLDDNSNLIKTLPPVFGSNNALSLFPSVNQGRVKSKLSLEKLENVKSQPVMVKFAVLNTELQECELSAEQNSNIESLKPIILSTLSSYMGAWLKSYFIPTAIFPRKHINEVTEAHSKIEQSASPREYLIELIKLWGLVSGDDSTTIGPKTVEILESAFILLGVKPEEKLEIKNVK